MPIISKDGLPEQHAGLGFQWKVQNFLKSYGKIYYFLIKIFSPVFSDPFSKIKIRDILKAYDEESIILNLGSGPNYFMGRKDIINIDIFPFKEVDIVANATDLPIEDESVDLIINVAMLEHVANPMAVVKEMHRIYRHFIRGKADVDITSGEVQVTYPRRGHNPILRDVP